MTWRQLAKLRREGADPANKELRLLRAVYGLCPNCNREDEHDHPVPVEIGTRVLYHDRVHVVRGHGTLADHPYPKLFGPGDWEQDFPDGVGYELWPEDVPFKFGNRDKATYFVRRTSFTVLDGEETTEQKEVT